MALFLNRGFTWPDGWAQAADGMLWLWTRIALDGVLGMVKITVLKRKANSQAAITE